MRLNLVVVAAAAVVLASGCAQLDQGSRIDAEPLEIGKDLEPGWERVDVTGQRFTVSLLGFQAGEVEYSATRYTDREMSRYVERQTVGGFDGPVSQLYIVEVDTSGLPDLMESQYGTSGFMDRAESRMNQRARDEFGLRLRRTGSRTEDGAKVRTYRGTYSFEPGSIQAGELDRTIKLPDGEVEIEARMEGRDCPGQDRKLVTVGVRPAEDVNLQAERQLTDSIDVSFDVDLDMRTAEQGREIRDMVDSLDCR